jgi:hypothetical protein
MRDGDYTTLDNSRGKLWTKPVFWGPGNSNNTYNLGCRWGRRGGRAPAFCAESSTVIVVLGTSTTKRAKREGLDKERAEYSRRPLEPLRVRHVNTSKQRIQVDPRDKHRLERAFHDQQRIQTHAQRINPDHWKLPVEIPSTKKVIPVAAPKVSYGPWAST